MLARLALGESFLAPLPKLLQPEDVAEYVAFIVTRPARVSIAEASPVSQFMKPIPNPSNLKPGI
jgi:hypothetical protein